MCQPGWHEDFGDEPGIEESPAYQQWQELQQLQEEIKAAEDAANGDSEASD